jgi:xylulose-5-phosphate/fructose-6-phosphate phosphoketolase
LAEPAFDELFTRATPVVFAFHGYQRAIHEIVHGRPNADRFHVRGFIEEGTTTTPFDMVVKNEMSRYHLCVEAVRRVPRLEGRADELLEHCAAMLARHESYIREHLEDMPEVREWIWAEA